MRIFNWSRIIVSLGILLSSCGDSGPDGATASTGVVTLGITDTPVDNAEKVLVRFTGVEFVPVDTGGTEIETITFAEPKTIDLLALQGGIRDLLLNGEELPSGQYTQVRLMVEAENDNVMDSFILVNGAQHELHVPGGSQTGLKLVHNFNIESDSGSDFTIDFDLRKSVVFSPGQGYMLKPVMRLVETARAGKISGTINPVVFAGQTCSDPLVGYAVYVYAGTGVTPDDLSSNTEPLTTTGATLNQNSNYAYTIGFLAPGNYTVAATCQAEQDIPDTNDTIGFVAAANVAVIAGTTVTHNFQ